MLDGTYILHAWMDSKGVFRHEFINLPYEDFENYEDLPDPAKSEETYVEWKNFWGVK